MLNLKAEGGASSINLTWNPPANTGGVKIDRYCIQAVGVGEGNSFPGDFPAQCAASGTTVPTPTADIVTSVGEQNGGLIVISGKKTEFEHKGLAVNTSWRYRVYAVNSVTSTAAGKPATVASNIATATVTSAVKPAAPTNLKLV